MAVALAYVRIQNELRLVENLIFHSFSRFVSSEPQTYVLRTGTTIPGPKAQPLELENVPFMASFPRE